MESLICAIKALAVLEIEASCATLGEIKSQLIINI
jgi:hypothetical protein